MLKRPPELLDVFMAFNNNRDWKQYGSPRDYDGIIWKDQPTLTREQVETKLAELQAEYDALQYQRDRTVHPVKGGYPEISDQLDMMWHDKKDGTTTWEDAVQAIKDKYPKGDN